MLAACPLLALFLQQKAPGGGSRDDKETSGVIPKASQHSPVSNSRGGRFQCDWRKETVARGAGKNQQLPAPPTATPLSCQCCSGWRSPERAKPCGARGGKRHWDGRKMASAQGFWYERVPTPSTQLPECPKNPRERGIRGLTPALKGCDGASFGGALKQKLFPPKGLHWEFLRPNSGSKTRKPTPGATHHICGEIASASLKHEGGTSPQRPVPALPHIKRLGFPNHHRECRGVLFDLTSMGMSGQSSWGFAKASRQTS